MLNIIKAIDFDTKILNEFNVNQFYIDDDVLILTHGGYIYEIPLIDLKDGKKAIFWIRQVEQKTWLDRNELSKFIQIICLLNGI